MAFIVVINLTFESIKIQVNMIFDLQDGKFVTASPLYSCLKVRLEPTLGSHLRNFNLRFSTLTCPQILEKDSSDWQ
jgi:hypothetical protein